MWHILAFRLVDQVCTCLVEGFVLHYVCSFWRFSMIIWVLWDNL